MTVRARLVQTKRVPGGTGVSYGHRHVTRGPATLGVVPLGYNEGMPAARLQHRAGAGAAAGGSPSPAPST